MPGVTPARTPEEIDSRIELWHSNPDDTNLYEYLGWSEQDYWTWVMKGTIP